MEPIPQEEQEQKQTKRYEYCDLHGYHVNSSKFWDCKGCKQHLCDYHFQNRRKHECILDQED